jgi:hypothetical protein
MRRRVFIGILFLGLLLLAVGGWTAQGLRYVVRRPVPAPA